MPPGGWVYSDYGVPVLLGGDAGYGYSTIGIDGAVHLVSAPGAARIVDVFDHGGQRSLQPGQRRRIAAQRRHLQQADRAAADRREHPERAAQIRRDTGEVRDSFGPSV